MKTLKILERYREIHRLIKYRSTGNPESFAKKLGISKSQLFNYLEELRDRGAEISYSKNLGSYFYRKPVELEAVFSVRTKEDEDQVSEKDEIYLPYTKTYRKENDQESEEEE